MSPIKFNIFVIVLTAFYMHTSFTSHSNPNVKFLFEEKIYVLG